jgi:hypothetical protein
MSTEDRKTRSPIPEFRGHTLGFLIPDTRFEIADAASDGSKDLT